MQAQLLSGSVPHQLWRLSLPMVWAILATSLFNVVDTFFIAQLGTNELIAMGFIIPVTMVMMGITIGIGIGVLSVMSRAIGRGSRDRVQHLTADSLSFAVLLIGVIALFAWIYLDEVFSLLGAGEEILPLIRDYMDIWYIGIVILSLPMAANAVIRASGDTLFPARVMVVAAIVNALLDPILIYGLFGMPRMGLSGSALATVVSYILTCSVVMHNLAIKRQMLTLSLFTENTLKSWKEIAHVGIPAAFTNMIAPLMVAATTWMVVAYGEEAVASLGIVTRLESLGIVAIFALSTGVSIMVGQNAGAGHHLRISMILRTGMLFSLLWGAMIAVLFIMGSKTIPSWFDDNNRVIHYASMYLELVPVSLGMFGVMVVTNAAFNAMGKPFPVVLLTLTRALAVYAPLAYMLQRQMGIEGIYWAIAVANVTLGLVAFVAVRQALSENADKQTVPS